MKATILVTAAGGPGAVNMTRSLMMDPELKLIGCDASQYYVHLAATPVKSIVPRCADTSDYLEAINRLCVRHQIDLIMPNNSLEAHVLAAHREQLNAAIFLPKVATLDIANSKWRSYKLWREHGLPVPKSWLIQNRTNLRSVFAEHQERPLWVRGAGIPGKGLGGAALPCKSLHQAEAWIDFYDGWGGMMASEYLPGDNLTWIGLFHKGELITSCSRRRLAYVIPHVSPSGITGAPAISEIIHRSDLDALGQQAALTVDSTLTGVSFLDFKCDTKGAPRITEMNAGRFGTTHHFYSVAGLNLPLMYVQLALRGTVDPKPSTYNPLPEGLTWIRTLDAGPVMLSRDAIERFQQDGKA